VYESRDSHAHERCDRHGQAAVGHAAVSDRGSVSCVCGALTVTSIVGRCSVWLIRSDDQKEFVSSIETCGDHLLTVINDILDFSKIEGQKLALEAVPFQLHQCVEQVGLSA